MKRIDRLCERAIKRTNRLVARMESEKLRSEAKIRSEQLTSANNCRNLPTNTTIRKEYVRCGKLDCPSKHGPYYYAYWKENEKLKKKSSIDKHKSSDIDCSASHTVIDPSNSTKTFE
jgi:hypothetical protein